MNYSGMDYLRIDVANRYGKDKELFADRISWVHTNDYLLETLEDTADDYYQYVAAVKAYRCAQAGNATGYLVGLDATASGPQLMSVITGCKVGAKHTNGIGQVRNDLYTATTEAMRDILTDMGEYTRNDVKYALMPYFYGSTQEPKNVFGDDTEEYFAFMQAANQVCPGASMLLPVMLDMWDSTALKYCWDLPDGFQVRYMVKNKADTKIEVDTVEPHITFKYRREINTTLERAAKIPANAIQSIDGYIVRELTSRCNYNANTLKAAKAVLRTIKDKPIAEYAFHEKAFRKHSALSLAGIESLDINEYSYEYAQALIVLIDQVLSKPSFEVLAIHDEFKAHPNNLNHVREVYRDILAELADSNILNVILSDVTGYNVKIEKLSENLSDFIKTSEYAIC